MKLGELYKQTAFCILDGFSIRTNHATISEVSLIPESTCSDAIETLNKNVQSIYSTSLMRYLDIGNELAVTFSTVAIVDFKKV